VGGHRKHGALIALALALAGCDAAGGASDVPDVASYEVTRRDLRVTVAEKGTLKAKNQILVRSKTPGQAKIVSLIDEGTLVEEGDILCELDATALEKEIEDLRNRIINLQGEVTAATAELEIQLSQNDADIQDAELKLKFANVELERFEKGEFVQEKTKRETKVEEYTSEVARAKRKYDQMPALLDEGFVTSDQVEEERIRLVKAESDLKLANLDLSTYLTYTAPKDLQQKQADVRNANLEVGRTKQRAAAREAQKRSALERQKSELSNVEARLVEQSGVLQNMIIRAPGPGIVIYGDARNPWDDREIKVGENVYSKQVFMTLPDLREMQAVLAVHEADITRVEAEQPAFVTVETARGRSIQGQVSRVALVPNSQRRRWGDNVKRFEVEVSLQGDLEGLELKPGLTSRVEILIDELKDVIAVPAQCVYAERGKYWVFQRNESGGYERAPVKIKPGNSQFVVITEGIEEGAQVALFNPEKAGESQSGGPPGAGGGEGGNGNGNGRP
jgi:HlyD family secretion protein